MALTHAPGTDPRRARAPGDASPVDDITPTKRNLSDSCDTTPTHLTYFWCCICGLVLGAKAADGPLRPAPNAKKTCAHAKIANAKAGTTAGLSKSSSLPAAIYECAAAGCSASRAELVTAF